MIDRRQFNRALACEEGFISFVNSTPLDEIPLRVLDLSVSGISFSSPMEFKPDDVLRLTFSLFVDYTISARARVLRTSDKTNCYCSFLRLTTQQEAKIAAYVSYRSASE